MWKNMKIGILSKRKTGLTKKISSYYEKKGFEVSIYTSNNLSVNYSLLNNDFYILKSKQLLFLYAGYFLKVNNIPVIPDPILSYRHKHRIESYYCIKNIGLNTPQIYLGTPLSIKECKSALEYPLIVKELMGSGSKGIKIIKNEDDLQNLPNKILYFEKYIEGKHYLAYFIDNHICVGEKQPLANEHSQIKYISPEKDIKQALMKWRNKFNLLFGHLDIIRENKTKKLIIVDPGTFPEFSNWKIKDEVTPMVCNLILKRYEKISNGT
jgi:hypothetical protein